MTGPLKNLKVLDFTRLLPGPLAGHILCRLGAQVVKVDIDGGDYTRKIPPKNQDGHGFFFESLNAEKLGLGLDLKHVNAASVIHRLAPYYDIIIEGNRPGVMDRLGVGYKDIFKVNSKIIYCSISGYGATGDYLGYFWICSQ